MKILLAPAETKNSGGNQASFCKENFLFPELFEKREEILNKYEELLFLLSVEELSKWFGLKKLDEVERYKESLLNKPSMKAINRYDGVAFDALDYNSLNKESQDFIDENVLLFSNLFGPLKASDLIPDYKYKQGAKLPDTNVEKFYMDNFTKILDDFVGEEVIDLRAGFYEKFYKVKNAQVLTFKFVKDGKVVSHWAKFYRGKVLQEIAKNRINSHSEFMAMQIPGLKLNEIQEKKNIRLLIMDIV
ncbi:YaaA family protein [Arcobacter sp. LA11]|uniref:YaaA family protein n=1 Tax=Arcobacter sp. LA11 TaxID=1898176 RepID=UPI000933DB65|nr:YaaA family protein [Arcobacter sp. LA11]